MITNNKISLGINSTLISIALLLSACGSLPPIVPQRPAPQADNHALPAGPDIQQANAFLASGDKREAASAYFAAANNYRSPYRERLILQAAELASIFKDTDLTHRYLEPIRNASSLSSENQARFRFVQAQLALNDMNYTEALRLLPQRVSDLPDGLGGKILNARMNAAQASGDKLSLVQELVLQESTLNLAVEKDLNNDRIWGQVHQLSLAKINEGRKKISHPIVRGWLDLAYIQKTNRNNETALYSRVKQWQSRHPNHPGNTKANNITFEPVATTTPYGGSSNASTITDSPDVTENTSSDSDTDTKPDTEIKEKINEAPYDKPALDDIKPTTSPTTQAPPPKTNHVAVILPLSGNLSSVGSTILNGIKEVRSKPIKVYDSNNADIAQLYEKAVNNGAQFVIGPFHKKNIATLAHNSSLKKPTLALNYVKSNSSTTENLYQFGLLPEDEAVQMAQFAINQGQKKVAILSPDSTWGLRLKDAMRTAVIERGGKVIINKTYANSSNDYSYVSKAIGVKESELDAILIVASPTQAQKLYPSLRSEMTTLPIYATSHVFNGRVNTGGDANLEGLIFTETPWIMDRIRNNTESSSRYPRLTALGIDAMMLANKLGQITDYSSALNGRTGRIRLSRDGTLHRTLMWAKFAEGKPVRYR